MSCRYSCSRAGLGRLSNYIGALCVEVLLRSRFEGSVEAFDYCRLFVGVSREVLDVVFLQESLNPDVVKLLAVVKLGQLRIVT